MAIGFEDMPDFVKEGNIWRHKDAHYIAKIGEKVLGYYLNQEMADNVVENYKGEILAPLCKLKREIEAERPAIHALYDKIDDAKRIISTSRAKIKKIEANCLKARDEYNEKIEQARTFLSDDEIEILLQNHKDAASIP